MTPFSFVLLSFFLFFPLINALALCCFSPSSSSSLSPSSRDARRRIIYETAFIHKHKHTAEGMGRDECKKTKGTCKVETNFHRFHQRQPLAAAEPSFIV
jgi:hypothetical protein